MMHHPAKAKLVKPPALRPGDTIGVVSPSWFGGDPFVPRAMHGIRTLEHLGYRVKIAPHAFNNRGHVSDTARNRAADINRMFADNDVSAILCTIGGSHSAELLPHLDFETITRHPKLFIGYSDITTLNVALHAATGLCTINGPYLLSDWAEYPAMPAISRDWTIRLVTEAEEVPGTIPCPPEWTREFLDWTTGEDRTRPRRYENNPGWTVLRHGSATGRLIGGCIESLQPLRGTPYWPDLTGSILFLETAGDLKSPEATDELLMGFENMGTFDLITGLLFAKPYDFTPEDEVRLDAFLRERTAKWSFPVIANMDFGHHTPMIAMPLGINATITTSPLRITIDEPVVSTGFRTGS
jgi:muramoyltetrapeptide carboxypeptidase LdcA involved in peptidoglycan recycling